MEKIRVKKEKRFYRLFLKERLALLSFLPTEGKRFPILLTSSELREKVGIDEEEKKKLNYEERMEGKKGQVTWNSEDLGKIIEITSGERELIVSLLTDIEQAEKMGIMHILLYQHFVLGDNEISEMIEEEAIT